jgi:hypothetical protein
MAEQLIFPGKVDWSGENPGMYLKETADGPFVTLLSFFRVMISPFEPFALKLPPEKSATGKHTMLSVFAGAKDGVATVNGRRLPGHAVPREMAGRQITTAFLAFAESWIR